MGYIERARFEAVYMAMFHSKQSGTCEKGNKNISPRGYYDLLGEAFFSRRTCRKAGHVWIYTKYFYSSEQLWFPKVILM